MPRGARRWRGSAAQEIGNIAAAAAEMGDGAAHGGAEMADGRWGVPEGGAERGPGPPGRTWRGNGRPRGSCRQLRSMKTRKTRLGHISHLRRREPSIFRAKRGVSARRSRAGFSEVPGWCLLSLARNWFGLKHPTHIGSGRPTCKGLPPRSACHWDLVHASNRPLRLLSRPFLPSG